MFEIAFPPKLQARVGAVGREKAKMLEELDATELAAAADQGRALQVNAHCQFPPNFDFWSFDNMTILPFDNLTLNGTIDTEERVWAEEAGVREEAEGEDRQGWP